MNQICLHFINEINLNLTNFKRWVKKNDVPQGKWQEIYHELLSLSKENILPRGALSRASKKHDISERTIPRLSIRILRANFCLIQKLLQFY